MILLLIIVEKQIAAVEKLKKLTGRQYVLLKIIETKMREYAVMAKLTVDIHNRSLIKFK